MCLREWNTADVSSGDKRHARGYAFQTGSAAPVLLTFNTKPKFHYTLFYQKVISLLNDEWIFISYLSDGNIPLSFAAFRRYRCSYTSWILQSVESDDGVRLGKKWALVRSTRNEREVVFERGISNFENTNMEEESTVYEVCVRETWEWWNETNVCLRIKVNKPWLITFVKYVHVEESSMVARYSSEKTFVLLIILYVWYFIRGYLPKIHVLLLGT